MIHNKMKRRVIASLLCVMMVLSILPSASVALADTESDGAPAAVEMADASETSAPSTPAAADESSSEASPAEEQADAAASPQDAAAASPQDAGKSVLLGEGDSEDDDDAPAAGVEHNLADYIKTLEVLGDPTSVEDGEKLTVKFGWLVEAGSYGADDTFTYQLPFNFDISAAATGSITQGEKGPRIGSYTVDTNGLVTIKYNADYNPSGQTTINYMEITGDAKYNPDSDNNEIKFEWENGSKVIVVTNTGDFTVEKEGKRTFENDVLSKNVVLEYTVKINSEKGTGGPFTITDTLTKTLMASSDTFTFDESSFVLKDGTGKTIPVTPTFDGSTFTIENVPTLGANGSYTLTYKVNGQWSGVYGNAQNSRGIDNKVSVTSDGITHTASKKITFTNVLRKAYVDYSNANKRIRWQAYMGTHGQNLAGFTFKDTADGEVDADSVTLSASDYNGSQIYSTKPELTLSDDGKTFSFTFPNVDKAINYWTVNYYTKVDAAPGTNPTISNTAQITNPKDETWETTVSRSVEVQGETTVEKKGTGVGEADSEGKVPLSWHSTVTYDNVDRNTFSISDKIKEAKFTRWVDNNGNGFSYSDSSTYKDDHYGYAEEIEPQLKDSLQITVKDGDTEQVLNYAQALEKGLKIVFQFYSDSDGNNLIAAGNYGRTHVKRFRVNIADVQTAKLTLLKVEFDYQTKFTTRHYADGSKWTMVNELSAETKYSTAEQDYEKTIETSGGISKQFLRGVVWVTDKYDVNYDDIKGTANFRLLASPGEGQTSMTVTDQLPEGFTLTDVQVGNYYKRTNKISTNWTENENVSITYDEATNLLTVKLDKLGTDLALRDDNMVVIEYSVKIDENFDQMEGAVVEETADGYRVVKNFVNTATNVEAGATDSIDLDVKRNQNVLTKEGSQIQENGAYTNRVRYSVVINAKGLDLLKDGDELTLDDIMSSEALDFKLDPSSVKLYTADENGNKVAEVEPLSLHIEQPEEADGTMKQSMTMTVSDETAYVLEYEYIADKRAAANAATRGEMNNVISLQGHATSSSDVTARGINVRVTSNFAGLQLVKVDEKNNAKFLTAEFELAKYNKDSDAYESMGTVTMSGKEGLSFDYYSENCALEGNTLYRITETKAPEGYAMDATPFYFIIRGNIQDVRTGKIDATNLVIAEEAAAMEAAGAPAGLDIKMLMPDSGSYFEITNPKETGALKVEKKWIGQVGESATIHLFANGTEVESVVLNAENNWKHSFENLPKTDDDDKVIEYTITEDAIDGYTTDITGDATKGFTVTNTDERITEVKVDKNWIGETSDSITVKLLANGKEVERKELTADDNWTYTFTNLPEYDADGKEITYTIEEVSLEGYISKVVESMKGVFDITNISTAKLDIPVSKEWKGGEEESVTINLLADGEVADTIVLTANDNWQGTFKDQPKYSTEDGHEIAYTIEEVKVDGYTTNITGDAANGFVVTNEKDTPPPPPVPTTTSVKVDKKWVGDEGESVTIKLLANGEEADSKTITANDNWTVTFDNLPINDESGVAIVYTIDEVKVDGYTTNITGDAANGFVVTNEKNQPETTSVQVEKKWVGAAAESVTIKLLADGEEADSKTITAADDWKATFDNLPKTNDTGAEITYTIEEVKVDGYDSEITGDAANGFVVTNTDVRTTEVKVDKNWIGEKGDSITVKLLANGEEVDSKELTADDNWTYTFTNLPEYDADGNAITYTIEEVSLEGYISKIVGSMKDGFNITNISTAKLDIPVSKEWKGGEEDSITINLLADGELVDRLVLTANENWQGTFKDQPKYSTEDGHEIAYTIEEVKVDGYTTNITGDAANGFVVTNEKDTPPPPPAPTTTSVKVDKKWIGVAAESVTIKLLADGEEAGSKTITANDNWTATFDNLPKTNAAGDEIAYTIEEVKMDGYESVITGDANTGYTVTNTNVTTTDIKVDKQWVGKAGDSVTVNLLADGQLVDRKVLTADDNWTATFTGLKKFDANDGHEIVYTIDEVKVDGYNTVITGDAANGFTITNTIAGKVSVGVTKQWKNRTGESATIHLMADGVEVDTVELTKDNNWQHTFTDLDKYKDGKEITYTITEDTMKRYTAKITGSVEEGFTVVNTYRPPGGGGGGGGGGSTPAYVSITAGKTLDGKTPTDNVFEFTLSDSEGKVLQTKKNNGGTITFDDLKFDTNGTYTYTVKEVAGNDEKVQYDKTVYTVTVVVTGGNNKKAEVTYTNDGITYKSIKFANTTKPDVPPEYPLEPEEPTNPDNPDKPTTPDNKTPDKPTTPGSKLPQTGLLWWPVGLLAAAGSTLVVASGVNTRKRGKDEDEEE